MTSRLTDKTCLITGASSGIGFYTAVELARMGAKLIMVSSRPETLSMKANELISLTGNTSIYPVPCDLSSQASIRKFAGDVLSSHESLDILINNAGVFRNSRNVTIDGYEWTFAVNHLAPFLLTGLLLGRMLRSSPARIINLVSSFHKLESIDLNDLHFSKKSYDGLAAYNRSKLANVMFTYELARKLEGTGITVNASDPLGTKSNISTGQKGWYGSLWNLAQPFLKTGRKGARTSVLLASSKELENTSGKYFKRQRIYPSSPSSYDSGISNKLWAECERLTGVSYDSVIHQYKNQGQS